MATIERRPFWLRCKVAREFCCNPGRWERSNYHQSRWTVKYWIDLWRDAGTLGWK